MKLFLTYCSWQKDDSIKNTDKEVPPDELYHSKRIQEFVNKCKQNNTRWAIFSDKYGVWFPNERKKWYDKHPSTVTESEYNQLCKQSLNKLAIYDVFFYGDTESDKFDQLYKDIIEYLRKSGLNIHMFDDLGDISNLSKENELYLPDSSILFLSICSRRKREEGFQVYSEKITDKISPFEKITFDKRNEIFRSLTKGELPLFENKNLKFHPYNQIISKGKDFYGLDSSYYLPAIWRYEGSCFQNFTTEDKKNLLQSGHHTLILSGLYGAISPYEDIQLYSVPLFDGNPVQNIWTENDFLTEVIVDYVERNNIKRIFDLTGIYYYRDLINWQSFNSMLQKKNIECDVMHLFSTLGTGDRALPHFSTCLSEYLMYMDSKDLRSILPEDEYEHVYFRSIDGARSGEISDFPFDEPMLDINIIKNEDAKKILLSAEMSTKYSYNNPNNPPDVGSSIIILYGKGVEKLLHQEITLKIGNKIRLKYGGKVPLSVKERPREENKLWDIFWYSYKPDSNQITLGQWNILVEKLRYNQDNKLVKYVFELMKADNNKFIRTVEYCNALHNIRNKATHPQIIGFDEGMKFRAEMVLNINKLLNTLYQN